jgi:ankyrin repeat protein
MQKATPKENCGNLKSFYVMRVSDKMVTKNTKLLISSVGFAWGTPRKDIDDVIKSGADVNTRTRPGHTPLHLISQVGRMFPQKIEEATEIAKMLIQNGAEVNARTSGGDTPLHYAILHRNLGLANLLIEKGADPNLQNNVGNTPLHIANASLSPMDEVCGDDVIGLLLKNGADPHIKNKEGKSALDLTETGTFDGMKFSVADLLRKFGVTNLDVEKDIDLRT